MKVTIACTNCKKKYKAWSSQRRSIKLKFCSVKCKGKWQTKHPFRVANTGICTICKKVYRVKKYALEQGKRKCCDWECRRKLLQRMIGPLAHNWKGGVQKAGQYLEQPRGHGKQRERILQHRRIMEDHLGRSLRGGVSKNSEVVHHIDGNKKNNNIRNLELMTMSEHSRHHALERRLGTHTRAK